mgnify:CR=1 FL=1
MVRADAKEGYFATVAADSLAYSASLAANRGSTTYLDFKPGEYDCWVDGAAAGDLLLVVYLPAPAGAAAPTIAPWAAPTAAANTQTAGVPTGASGAGQLPAERSPLRIPVLPGYRCAVVCTAAGATTLRASKVL